MWGLRATSCARAADSVQGSEEAKFGRGGGQVSDKMRGDEVRCIAAHRRKEGVQNMNFWAERHLGSPTDFSIGTLSVCDHTEEHFKVYRKKGSGYGRRNKWASRTAIFCILTSGSVG